MPSYPTSTYNARTVAELDALHLGGDILEHSMYENEIGEEMEAVEADLRAAIADGNTATDFQERLVEIDTAIGGVSTTASAHIADATAAHAATAISYAGGTGMSATEVEAALDELATEKMNSADLTAHIDDATDAHDASTIPFLGHGYLPSAGVQAVLETLYDLIRQAPNVDIDWFRDSPLIYEEFLTTTALPPGWQESLGVTGSVNPATSVSGQIADHPGVYHCSTAGNANGYAALTHGLSGANSQFYLQGRPFVALFIVRTPSAAADLTNAYDIAVGFVQDATQAMPLDGVTFVYETGTTKWHGRIADGGTSEECATTAFPTLAFPEWYVLGMVGDGAESCAFFVNGSGPEVAFGTTAFPDIVLGVSCGAFKLNGTTARQVTIDTFAFMQGVDR